MWPKSHSMMTSRLQTRHRCLAEADHSSPIWYRGKYVISKYLIHWTTRIHSIYLIGSRHGNSFQMLRQKNEMDHITKLLAKEEECHVSCLRKSGNGMLNFDNFVLRGQKLSWHKRRVC